MQAVFIFLLASVIVVISGLMAWYYTREPVRTGADQELTRLRNHALWLEQRLDTARRERWDPKMIVTLSEQLGSACQELAYAERGCRTPSTARVH